MKVIMRLQDQGHCASITCMIRHYAEPAGRCDLRSHRHNAAYSACQAREDLASGGTGSPLASATADRAPWRPVGQSRDDDSARPASGIAESRAGIDAQLILDAAR